MEWIENNGRLEKTFTLSSFSAIAEKLLEVAKASDEMDHHPDVKIFGYKNVTFSLITHSQKKITEKDHQLSRKIDAIFG